MFATIAPWIVLVAAVSAMSAPDPTPLFKHFTGVSRAVQQGPGNQTTTLYDKAFGFSYIPGAVPLTTSSVFAVGSNTKLITAIAIYQLQERHLLNVSDNVAKYLNQSDFAAFGYPNITTYCPRLANSTTCEVITFVDLLGMSSGIPNIDLGPTGQPPVQTLQFPGSIGLVVGVFIMWPLHFAPGTSYEYSNPNFNLCTYIVEKLSGLTYQEYVQRHIAGPAKMTHTIYDQQNGKFNRHGRVGEYYVYADPATGAAYANGDCSNEVNLGCLNGAGGLLASAPDYASLYFTLFGNLQGGSVLSPASSKQLIMPRFYSNFAPPAYNGTFWYGQGLFLGCASSSRSVPCSMPQYIYYGGQTVCSNTANVYDFSKGLLTQVFSNNIRFIVEEASYQQAAQSGAGTFGELTGKWEQSMSTSGLAFEMSMML